MMATGGEEGQLGAGRGLHPPDDEPHRCGAGLAPEGVVVPLEPCTVILSLSNRPLSLSRCVTDTAWSSFRVLTQDAVRLTKTRADAYPLRGGSHRVRAGQGDLFRCQAIGVLVGSEVGIQNLVVGEFLS